MTSPTVKNNQHRSKNSFASKTDQLPLLLRRLGAWVVEVSLLGASMAVPYTLGAKVPISETTTLVPLNPVLEVTGEAIAKNFGLPRPPLSQKQVAPLTNFWWWTALLTPTILVGYQLYRLGKTGQTLPKSWFKLRVVTEDGRIPDFKQVFLRETIGKWGLPGGLAYIFWRYTGLFPDLGLLIGLTSILLVVETGQLFFNPRRRCFHDRLGGTWVIDARHRIVSTVTTTEVAPPIQPITLEVQNRWPGLTDNQENPNPSLLTTITISPQSKPNLWQWMRQHPGTTLMIFTCGSMLSVLGTFVGTQIYIQSQANRRQNVQQNNEVFVALVQQFSNTNNNIEARRAAILALARLEDSRVFPLLTDLLGQETNPELIETLQQALASGDPTALESLKRLNQSIRNDLKSLPQDQEILVLRLRATKRAIAKILNLYTGQIGNQNLDRIDLGQVKEGTAQFNLVLDKIDLSGINFRGTSLLGASVQNSKFYGTGEDQRLGTFDDAIADLSGTDLKEANLSGSIFTYVPINRSNLMRVNLQKANLNYSQLIGSNLSSSNLNKANFEQAILEKASLTGAEAGEANFSRSNLAQANLGELKAIGANFSYANLSQSTWQNANLMGANFQGANLENANLSQSELTAANLQNANLQNANLTNANLSSANLQGANLDNADFKGVILATKPTPSSDSFVELPPNNESAANVKGVDFSNVKNINSQQLNVICSQGGFHRKCQ